MRSKINLENTLLLPLPPFQICLFPTISAGKQGTGVPVISSPVVSPDTQGEESLPCSSMGPLSLIIVCLNTKIGPFIHEALYILGMYIDTHL